MVGHTMRMPLRTLDRYKRRPGGHNSYKCSGMSFVLDFTVSLFTHCVDARVVICLKPSGSEHSLLFSVLWISVPVRFRPTQVDLMANDSVSAEVTRLARLGLGDRERRRRGRQ